MELTRLPDDLLIRVCESSSPGDVVRFKQSSRRLLDLIERHNVARPEVSEFSIESRVTQAEPTPLGRLRLKPYSGRTKRHTVLTMRRRKATKRVECVDDDDHHHQQGCSQANELLRQNMRKVTISERLSFDGVTIDDEFYAVLTAKWNDLKKVSSLALSMCSITIDAAKFADLVGRMTNLQSLVIEFCTFSPMLLSDRLLMSLPKLSCFKVQPRGNGYFPLLTNHLLYYWSANKNVPRTIFLYNCATNFTVDAVRDLMMNGLCKDTDVGKETPTAKDIGMDWDFGKVLDLGQSEAVLLGIVMQPGLSVGFEDDFRSRRLRVVCRASSFQLCLNLFRPLNYESAVF